MEVPQEERKEQPVLDGSSELPFSFHTARKNTYDILLTRLGTHLVS